MDERILKYFQNSLAPNERLLLLREIEKNEELKKQFAEYQNIQALLNLSSHTEDKKEGETSYQHFQKRIKSKKMRIWLVKTMKYAAAILILMISTYQLSIWQMSHKLQDDFQVQTNTLYVPAGQRACISLQDGTVVWLNAQSTLTYPSHFYGKERTVSIIGEAFFEVAKDKNRPFIVAAQDAKIQVLGTKFNVYSYPDSKQIRTSLIEGAVQVFYKSKQVILRPNEESIAQDGKLTVSNIKNPDMLLWRNGIYSFNNERLADIVNKLELYYDVTINIANPKLKDINYTCKLNSYGYVTEVIEDNDEKDGAIYYKLEYDKNGYLQHVEKRYSYNESRIRVSECTWRDGNLVEYTAKDYNEDDTEIETAKISYSKTATPINIDLLYFSGYVPVDVYPLDLLGFCGRQSAKLPDKVDVVWGSESDSVDLGVYTLNNDGTVARIDGGAWSYELIY